MSPSQVDGSTNDSSFSSRSNKIRLLQPIICYLSVTSLRSAKTAKLINVLFRVNALKGPWNIVLDKGPDAPTRSGGEWGYAYCTVRAIAPARTR